MGRVTITEFLLARIAEDEEQATRSKAEVAAGKKFAVFASWINLTADRMLAECEAKRRIVDLAQSVDGDERYAAEVIGGVDGDTVDTDGADILRALASVYADHPEFDEAWLR